MLESCSLLIDDRQDGRTDLVALGSLPETIESNVAFNGRSTIFTRESIKRG